MSNPFEAYFRQRVRETDVARILSLIAERPNQRKHPRPDDLAGDFDYWFDGGACRLETGYTTYRFDDGTTALVAGPHPQDRLEVWIEFRDGRAVSVVQKVR